MRQEMIDAMAAAMDDMGTTRELAEQALDALLDALEAKQPILEAYELIEVLRGES